MCQHVAMSDRQLGKADGAEDTVLTLRAETTSAIKIRMVMSTENGNSLHHHYIY